MYNFAMLGLKKQHVFDFTTLSDKQAEAVNKRLEELEPFVNEYFELSNKLISYLHVQQGQLEPTVVVKPKKRGSLFDMLGRGALKLLNDVDE